MATSLTLDILHGAAIAPVLDAVAALRIAVFRDWPYLYDGDVAYERAYLQAYVDAPCSVLALVRDGDAVVGASTGIPLIDDAPAFRAAFDARGIDAATVFYCGESVLLPAYRGRGIGHAFFDAREAHARASGLTLSAFAAVDRADNDPRRPPDHRDNDAFWRKRGYAKQPDMQLVLDWNEIDRDGIVHHTLTFWTRTLEPRP